MKKIIIALLVASLMVITATAGVEQAGVEQLASCSSDECGAILKYQAKVARLCYHSEGVGVKSP